MNKYKVLKWGGVIFVLIVVTVFAVNTVIAYQIVSGMSDVRVERNLENQSDFGLEGEQISLMNEEGISIHSYVFPKEEAEGIVVILHGMHGMDASSLFDYAKFVNDAGYTAVNIDMRAHGRSGGERIAFGYKEVYDVLAVMENLREDDRFKELPIILYGLSMGGSTAINVAAKSEEIAAVIAVSPYLSIQTQVKDYMEKDGFPALFIQVFMPSVNLVLWTKLGINPYTGTPEKSIESLRDIPVLLVHGGADSQTAVYQSEALYVASGSSQTELWIIEGKDHLILDDVLKDENTFYREEIENFLAEVIAK